MATLLVPIDETAVEYVGNCEWEESADYVLDLDEYGMDTLTRTYQGRRDKLGEFLRSFQIHTPDYEYPQLTYTSRRVMVGKAFASVTLTFAGLFDDVLPPVVVEGGFRPQELSIQKTDSNETLVLSYNAPFTTYKYVARRKPKRQRFPHQLENTALGFHILSRRGSRGAVRIADAIGGVPGLMLATSKITPPNVFEIWREVVCADFTFRQAGRYWEVTEQNEGRLMEREREDIPRVLGFAI